jgi:cellulose synthase/poly-beta-1,6-N-acetylglucosamine synthase-like glycosyltransferase
MEVIVIDDGSADRTAAEVETLASSDRRVRLLRQPNRGKARALQRGLAAMRTGIAVFLDADTHCQRDTLRRLVEPFSDEKISGVSGHAKVGNLRTFIARCQALEYTCGSHRPAGLHALELHDGGSGRDQRDPEIGDR